MTFQKHTASLFSCDFAYFNFSELSEVKDHDRRVTQEAQQAQEDVSYRKVPKFLDVRKTLL